MDAANVFREFARSGSQADLVRLADFEEMAGMCLHIRMDYLERSVLESCVSRYLTVAHRSGNRISGRVWNMFLVLLADRFYAGAQIFREEFHGYPEKAYDTMLQYAEQAISQPISPLEQSKALTYLTVLTQFGERVHLRSVCSRESLRRAILTFMDERFTSDDRLERDATLRAIWQLLGPERPGQGPGGVQEHVWPFLREGALGIVTRAALHDIKQARTEAELVAEAEDVSNRIEDGILPIQNALVAALNHRLQYQEQGLPAECLLLGSHDLHQLVGVLYDLLNGAWLLSCISGLLLQLDIMNRSTTLCEILLYQPEEGASSKPLAAVLRRSMKESKHMPEIESVLRRYARINPTIAAASESAVEKDRHCAFPGCQTATGEGEQQNKKCSRCRAVYYCGVEHQREHWPVHRKISVKAATASEK